jgi:hypothetical protein
MDSEKNEVVQYDKMSAESRALALASETSVFLNVAKFEQMQRVAHMLSKSDFVPEKFRGNVGNCIVALDLAERMQMHPIMLMQTMYIVHGSPGFEGKFMSALINNSGRYTDPLEYEWKGKEGKTNSHPGWGCRAYATRKQTGKVVYGPWVTWEMVVLEGWNKPKGSMASKWIAMPELMFMYRAASFFVNANDSDLKMGMQTMEELEDVHDMVAGPSGTYTTGDGPKSADLYKPTKTAPAEEVPTKTKPADDEQEESPDAPDDQPDGRNDEYQGPWIKPLWRMLKGPGMVNFARENEETWPDAPATIKMEFKEKWGNCKGLEEKPFPFDEAEPEKADDSADADEKDRKIDSLSETVKIREEFIAKLKELGLTDDHMNDLRKFIAEHVKNLEMSEKAFIEKWFDAPNSFLASFAKWTIKKSGKDTVSPGTMERFYKLWEHGDEYAKKSASEMLNIDGKPNPNQVDAWIKFYDAYMEKLATVKGGGSGVGKPDFLGGDDGQW